MVRWTARGLGVALLLAATSCQPSSILPVGHLEGNLTRILEGKLATVPVKGDFAGTATTGDLKLTALDGSSSSLLSLRAADRSNPTLTIADVGTFTLQADGTDCFAATRPNALRVCASATELLIDVRDPMGALLYGLTLDLFPADQTGTLEPPRAYGLDEAVRMSLEKNFENRVEFERMMQARHLASSAYLNLLPHLNAGSLLGLASGGGAVAAALGSVGNLVPFLFPSRWHQAREDRYLAEAEADTLLLMRGNTGVQVEGFAYSLARDAAIQADYAGTIAEMTLLGNRVGALERLGSLPFGSRDLVQTSINHLLDDAAAIDQSLSSTKRYASQALGMLNPDAITSLEIPPDSVAIDQAVPLEKGAFSEIAITRSFELRQMGALLEAARSAVGSVTFNWLDPSGDPSQQLGFGLRDQVQIARSRIEALKAQRDQVKAVLLQRADELVESYNLALAAFERGSSDLRLQQSRVARISSQLALGIGPTQLDLATAHLDFLRAKISVQNSIALYRLARAKKDRLLLQGYYSHLELQR